MEKTRAKKGQRYEKKAFIGVTLEIAPNSIPTRIATAPSSISFPSVSGHMTIETDPLQSPLSQSSLAQRDFRNLAAIIRRKNPSPGQSMSPPARRFHRTMILAQ